MPSRERLVWLSLLLLAQAWSILLNRVDFAVWLQGWLSIFALAAVVFVATRRKEAK